MGAGSDSLSQRPIPLAMLYDNTTVQGRWIHIDNMSNTSLQYSSDKYKRTVTNVTIAMPHAGIFAATRDPINQILQPQDLDVGYVTDQPGSTADMTAGPWRV